MSSKSPAAIEVICGSMFCGKTEELIRRMRRSIIARNKVQVFKPIIDNRYVVERVHSHAGIEIDAIPIAEISEVYNYLDPETSVVGIDEAQFFDKDLIDVCEDLADQGIRVIVAGLDRNFRGEPFGIMPILLARAEYVTKLNAICQVCGAPATRTQRLINGKPAHYQDPEILVGAKEQYEARCRHCHVVLGKK